MIKKIFFEIDGILHAISHFGKSFKIFKVPLLFSIISFTLLAFSIYLSGLVIGTSLPIMATLIIVSVFALTSILPISVGGLGAPQLIIALCFSSLGVSPQMAASTSLINTGITLFSTFFMALFFLRTSAKQVLQTIKVL